VVWHSYACCSVDPAFVHSRITTVNGCPDNSGRPYRNRSSLSMRSSCTV
jgi:hypothetical protein